MSRLKSLQQEVESLYNEKRRGSIDWIEWIFSNHVLVVTNNAKKIAERVGADIELSQIAALLHDIADIKMGRNNPKHETESLKIARQLMKKYGYPEKDINLVVDDAIRFHSCHGNERPKSKEGKVLATADALAHLQTDFYIFATWDLGKRQSLEDIKNWVLPKLERDFNNKISFDDIREEARPNYETLKMLFRI